MAARSGLQRPRRCGCIAELHRRKEDGSPFGIATHLSLSHYGVNLTVGKKMAARSGLQLNDDAMIDRFMRCRKEEGSPFGIATQCGIPGKIGQDNVGKKMAARSGLQLRVETGRPQCPSQSERRWQPVRDCNGILPAEG